MVVATACNRLNTAPSNIKKEELNSCCIKFHLVLEKRITMQFSTLTMKSCPDTGLEHTGFRCVKDVKQQNVKMKFKHIN